MIALSPSSRFFNRLAVPALLMALVPACTVSGQQASVYQGYGVYPGYGTPRVVAPAYGYYEPGYDYGAPVYRRGYGVPVYRDVPRNAWNQPYEHRSGFWEDRRERPRNRYANNGRCDDPRYETSNGGRAAPGTDEADCRKYGDGRK